MHFSAVQVRMGSMAAADGRPRGIWLRPELYVGVHVGVGTEAHSARSRAGCVVSLSSVLRDCLQCRGACGLPHGVTSCALGILTKWFPPTRPETRTKESNMYASIRVANP